MMTPRFKSASSYHHFARRLLRSARYIRDAEAEEFLAILLAQGCEREALRVVVAADQTELVGGRDEIAIYAASGTLLQRVREQDPVHWVAGIVITDSLWDHDSVPQIDRWVWAGWAAGHARDSGVT